MQLVERFYDPVEGSVEVDGIPMTELDLASLRRHVGLVAQEPVLFGGERARARLCAPVCARA